jgi:GntR family transcriptional repressor for pyruvate dehydrogenase complex
VAQARGNGTSARVSSRPYVPKMAELVAAEIRDEILRGEYQPGDSLSSEAALVERFDVSRPTLREALRLLESQQLITVRRGSHRGPVASLPDAELTARSFALLLQLRKGTVADIYQFRMTFEPAAARMAAEHATDAELSSLRGVLDAEFTSRDDFSAFTVFSWRFHSELARLSGNPAMALMAETFERISQRHAAEFMSNVENSQEQSELAYRAHARLVSLLEKRKGKEAERFWARHMAAAGERLLANTKNLSIIELVDH